MAVRSSYKILWVSSIGRTEKEDKKVMFHILNIMLVQNKLKNTKHAGFS